MAERKAIVVSQEELDVQREFMQKIRAHKGTGGMYTLITYGCQMNEHDSETLAGMLGEMGYVYTADKELANVILFNTCCVRDNAERKVFGNVAALRKLKSERPNLIIGVCGCMMQQEGVAQTLMKRNPHVDLVFGTHNLHRFPELMYNALASGEPVLEVEHNEMGHIAEALPIHRTGGVKGYLTIMYGCDNFCSYCIVPYVRGRERSREIVQIVLEAKELAKSGMQEITLLGQNVNSFGKDTGQSFDTLLRSLDGIVPRIRFMTSHPKDLSDALIRAMTQLPSVCPQFHLPVQSGSDRILAEMNRHYTRAHYLERVAALRDAIPGIGISTDVIIGFPGETQDDFNETLSLIQEVKFDLIYTFLYSARKGTKAALMEGHVEKTVVHTRMDTLLRLQESLISTQLQGLVGQTQEVLVESVSKRMADQVCGRTARGLMVNVAGPPSLIGHIVPVQITGAGANTLRAVLRKTN